MTTEEALLVRLGSVFETVDPVPFAAQEAAVQSLSWRDPDAALAELVLDSLTAPATIRTRPATGPRLLTFAAGELSIEVEVADLGDSCRLLGQVVPPQPAEVEVRWKGGHVSVVADELGRFSAGPVPRGPISLACSLSNRVHRVVTSWVTV